MVAIWPHAGRAAAPSGPQDGPLQAAAWPHHGRSLATCGPLAGLLLASCWPLAGLLLATFWLRPPAPRQPSNMKIFDIPARARATGGSATGRRPSSRPGELPAGARAEAPRCGAHPARAATTSAWRPWSAAGLITVSYGLAANEIYILQFLWWCQGARERVAQLWSGAVSPHNAFGEHVVIVSAGCLADRRTRRAGHRRRSDPDRLARHRQAGPIVQVRHILATLTF
jgi:hypothetical protein